jgi:hypothetical protein
MGVGVELNGMYEVAGLRWRLLDFVQVALGRRVVHGFGGFSAKRRR